MSGFLPADTVIRLRVSSVGAGRQHLGLGVDQKATQGLTALPALRRAQLAVEDGAPG